IAFGKFVNAGQTCIAPDFIFIHPKVEKQFIAEIKKVLETFYGDEPEASPYFARIINEQHYHRIKQYVLKGDVLIGGQTNSKKRYIAPTLIKIDDLNDEVMQHEIFGPVLPIVNYNNISEIVQYNHENDKPLAFYVFGDDSAEIETLLNQCKYGGACVNDCLSHIINNKLPFGGIGASGFGNYHGKFSFEAFSQTKAVVYRKTWYDNKLKYPPYTKNKLNLLKRLFKFL
ncbi:MAG: aldehyde dehydrogenase family protein, partial [Myroides sp.]